MAPDPVVRPASEPHLAQVAWAVRDLPRACRFYTEVLGFRRAGGRLLWGPGLSVVQELGDDAAATLWWALGGQEFVQLEFFHHTLPIGRERPSTWRPCDLGWARVAIGVADLDAVLARAAAAGHLPLGPVLTDGTDGTDGTDRVRRCALRDPDGVVVEIIGDGGVTGNGDRPRPAVRSVTVSVADLDRARRFWVDTCGLTPLDPAALHQPHHEALWGLEGAHREQFVARGVDVAIEVVRYDDPVGAAPPADQRLCDQGLLNVALAFRDRDRFDTLLERVLAAGYRATVECPPGPFASTYLRDDQGCSVEIFACPPDHDALLGFTIEPGFAPGWPLDE